MRITTHACILGAWAPVAHSRRLLDIGAGTGLLSLMAAQRCQAHIDAVEIETGAALDARENFAASPWAARLQLHETPIQLFVADTQAQRYDTILSNPPFFSGALPNADAKKALARHEGGLTHAELVVAIARLLRVDGQAHVLLPADNATTFMQQALASGLYVVARLDIRSLPDKPQDRVIMSLAHQPAATMQLDALCVYADYPAYHPAYAELMRDYYLHLP